MMCPVKSISHDSKCSTFFNWSAKVLLTECCLLKSFSFLLHKWSLLQFCNLPKQRNRSIRKSYFLHWLGAEFFLNNQSIHKPLRHFWNFYEKIFPLIGSIFLLIWLHIHNSLWISMYWLAYFANSKIISTTDVKTSIYASKKPEDRKAGILSSSLVL